MKDLKKKIEEMDVKSDEFFELYKLTNKKYWDFKDPDNWQQACQLINTWLMHGTEEEHIVVASMVAEIFKMRSEKRKACTGTIGFTEETFHFDIYTTEPEMDGLHGAMINAAKGLEKNGKFGKNYFKKK